MVFIGDIFDPFAKIYQQLQVKRKPIFTDNWISNFHQKWSYILSYASLMFMISYVMILPSNDLIVCFGPNTQNVPKEFVAEWCLVHGTYVNPQYGLNDKDIGRAYPHPGIGPDEVDMEKVYHFEYMLYPVILLLQLLLFRAPKYLWKCLEGKRLKGLLSEFFYTDEDKDKKDALVLKADKIQAVADYMTSSITFHSTYAYQFVMVELFNASTIIAQFCLINWALKDEFFNYGWNAVSYLRSDVSTHSASPFLKMFPKVTKCIVPQYGSGGGLQPHEALCVLPWNNAADKLFLFWWFWLAIMGCFTVLELIYRTIALFSSRFRYTILRVRTNKSKCNFALLKDYCMKKSYGDWFILTLIQMNVLPSTFNTLVEALYVQSGEGKKKAESVLEKPIEVYEYQMVYA